MSSEASSEQLCVRKGTGYDEVYPSGQDNPGTSYDERVPSANSPSVEEEKDSDVDRSKSGSSGGKTASHDDKVKFVEDETRPLEVSQTAKEKD
nr:hypothetical protein CFP56_26568 [Quercus suber]